MSTLAEIEQAIEKLPAPQVEELASWLNRRRGAPGASSAGGASVRELIGRLSNSKSCGADHGRGDSHLARTALEALVAQGFREWRLSRAEVQDVLGLSWHETEAFLARSACDRHYTEEDLAQDRQTLADLFDR